MHAVGAEEGAGKSKARYRGHVTFTARTTTRRQLGRSRAGSSGCAVADPSDARVQLAFADFLKADLLESSTSFAAIALDDRFRGFDDLSLDASPRLVRDPNVGVDETTEQIEGLVIEAGVVQLVEAALDLELATGLQEPFDEPGRSCEHRVTRLEIAQLGSMRLYADEALSDEAEDQAVEGPLTGARFPRQQGTGRYPQSSRRRVECQVHRETDRKATRRVGTPVGVPVVKQRGRTDRRRGEHRYKELAPHGVRSLCQIVRFAQVADLWSDYTAASQRLVKAVARRANPDSQDIHTIQRVLDGYLASMNLDRAAREDVIAETMLLLISGIRRGVLDEENNVSAYIRTIAVNCMRDASRYRARRPTTTIPVGELPEPPTDDSLAALLDAVDSAEEVHAALGLAGDDGEVELVVIISRWLQLAERLGDAPSLREAADELEVSHMRISRALSRFVDYVHEARRARLAGQPGE